MSVQPFNDDGAIQPVPQAAHQTTDFAEIDAVLMGAPPAVQFKDIGAMTLGRIVRVVLRQASDFESKELKWWPDGAPIMEPVITLETADGPATLYAGSSGMREALREACRQAGAGLRPGGQLAVKYSGNEEPKRKGASPRKLYEAAYDPPGQGPALPKREGPLLQELLEHDRSRVTQMVTQAEPPF